MTIAFYYIQDPNATIIGSLVLQGPTIGISMKNDDWD